MRTGIGQFQQTSPEYLLFAQQFGATDILLNTPALPSYGGTWAWFCQNSVLTMKPRRPKYSFDPCI